MQKRYLQSGLLLFFLMVILPTSFAQTNTKTTQTNKKKKINPHEINISFRKTEIKGKKNTLQFNIVTIHNLSEKEFDVKLDISIPRDWVLITPNNQEITVPANDSILVPLRMVIAPNVKGGVAYLATVTLRDEEDVFIKSNSFTTMVTPKPEFSVKPVYYVEYIDARTNSTNFSIHCKNIGNIDALLNVALKLDKHLYVSGSENNQHNSAYFLPVGSDTIISFRINYNNIPDGKSRLNMFKINVNWSTNDTTATTSLWVNYLENKYTNIIPDENKCLVVEYTLQNAFANDPPTSELSAVGVTYLKNRRQMSYNLLSYYRKDMNLARTTLFQLNYTDSTKIITLGYFNSRFQQSISGYGAQIEYFRRRSNYLLAVTKSLRRDIYNFGVLFNKKIRQRSWFETGYVVSQNQQLKKTANMAFAQVNMGSSKQNLSIFYAFTNNTYINNDALIRSKLGNGLTVMYNVSASKLYFNIIARHGSPYYTGIERSQTNIASNLFYTTKLGMLKWNTNFHNYNYIPEIDSSASFQIHQNRNTNLIYNRIEFEHKFKDNIFIGLGGITERNFTDAFSAFKETGSFTANTIRGLLTVRIRSNSSQNSFFSIFTYGKTFVDNTATLFYHLKLDDVKTVTSWNVITASIFLKRRYWGAIFNYYYGPNTIEQQAVNYFLTRFPVYFSLNPFYQRHFLNDKLEVAIRLSILNNIAFKNTRSSLNTDFRYHLGKGWSVHLLNNVSMLNTKSEETGAISSFLYNYTEVGVRKVFDFQQPRLKYCNFVVVVFKDLNADHERQANEPGINNVIVNLESAGSEINQKLSEQADYSAPELLTNIDGTATYENIPNGFYKVRHRLIGSLVGAYAPDTVEYIHRIKNKHDTLSIPYLEKDKLFGKVTVNKDKYSLFGTIDIGGIRVTAFNAKREEFTTLTNKDGEFVLYLPRAGKYKVTINNVFKPDFVLQQDTFNVKFNGYKQFEISFIFNEKVRPIDPSPSDQLVHKVELIGAIFDAQDQVPMHASLKVIDSTGVVIDSCESNPSNGYYYLTFLSGQGYKQIISAPGHKTDTLEIFLDQVLTIQTLVNNISLYRGENRKQNPNNLNEKQESDKTPKPSPQKSNKKKKQNKTGFILPNKMKNNILFWEMESWYG